MDTEYVRSRHAWTEIVDDDNDELVRDYAAAVIAQSEAIERGDAKAGNRMARRYLRAWEELRANGDAGRDALMVLFEHEHAEVRVMAAAMLLRHAEAAATKVLEAESSEPGMAGLGARQALARWREGTWALDPPDEG